VRRRAETRRAVVILVVAVLAIVGVGVALYLSRTPKLDVATGCPVGQRVPPEHTVVLIDQTDPLTPRQIDYAKSVILAEYDRLKPEGKLTISSIRADVGEDEHDFSRCRVRRGADVSDVTANPEMIEAQFRHTVGDALNDYLNSLRHVPTAPRSPIIETVDAALDAPDFGPTVKARRLTIISDMAQNSPEPRRAGRTIARHARRGGAHPLRPPSRSRRHPDASPTRLLDRLVPPPGRGGETGLGVAVGGRAQGGGRLGRRLADLRQPPGIRRSTRKTCFEWKCRLDANIKFIS
jgi:hypothetical protein